MMQAMAGWMSLTGDPDGPPTKSGLSLVDLSGGYVSAIALLAGLWRARRDGVGCDCDISLFETALHELMYIGTWAATAGYAPQRHAESAHPSIVPFQAFQTADGWITVACAKQKFWELLLRGARPRGPARRPALRRLRRAQRATARSCCRCCARRSRARTTDEWLGGPRRGGRAHGPVYEVGEALEDPQARRPRGRRRDRAPAVRHRPPARLAAAAERRAQPARAAVRTAASTPTSCCAICAATPTTRSPRCGRRGRSESPARSRLHSRAGGLASRVDVKRPAWGRFTSTPPLGGPLRGRRAPQMPVGDLLVGVGSGQHGRLVETACRPAASPIGSPSTNPIGTPATGVRDSTHIDTVWVSTAVVSSGSLSAIRGAGRPHEATAAGRVRPAPPAHCGARRAGAGGPRRTPGR